MFVENVHFSMFFPNKMRELIKERNKKENNTFSILGSLVLTHRHKCELIVVLFFTLRHNSGCSLRVPQSSGCSCWITQESRKTINPCCFRYTPSTFLEFYVLIFKSWKRMRYIFDNLQGSKNIIFILIV